MLKPEAKFERLVEIVYKLDDKEWYTWYLNDSTKDTLLDFLEENIVMRGLDFTRGTIYRTIWDSTDERTIGIAQDITSCVKEIIEDKYTEYCHEYLDKPKSKCRSKEVTKQQLEDLGIVCVTEDGDVYVYNGKEVVKKTPIEVSGVKHKYSTNKKRYLYLYFYNPITHKYIGIALHRIVYAWFNGVARAGMTIDHIDNNGLNNNIHNLREVTLEENLSYKKISRNQYNWDLSDEEILSRRYEIESKRELKKEQKKINKDIDKQVEELNIKIKNKLEYLHVLEEAVQAARQRKNDGDYEGYLDWKMICKSIKETKNDIKRLKEWKQELLSKKISFKN